MNTWAEEREDTTSGAAGTVTSAGAGVAKGKPNVFFIMIDDMGWNDIGYQSTDLVGITPNLDKLAAGGVKVRKRSLKSLQQPQLKRVLDMDVLLTPSWVFNTIS